MLAVAPWTFGTRRRLLQRGRGQPLGEGPERAQGPRAAGRRAARRAALAAQPRARVQVEQIVQRWVGHQPAAAQARRSQPLPTARLPWARRPRPDQARPGTPPSAADCHTAAGTTQRRQGRGRCRGCAGVGRAGRAHDGRALGAVGRRGRRQEDLLGRAAARAVLEVPDRPARALGDHLPAAAAAGPAQRRRLARSSRLGGALSGRGSFTRPACCECTVQRCAPVGSTHLTVMLTVSNTLCGSSSSSPALPMLVRMSHAARCVAAAAALRAPSRTLQVVWHLRLLLPGVHSGPRRRAEPPPAHEPGLPREPERRRDQPRRTAAVPARALREEQAVQQLLRRRWQPRSRHCRSRAYQDTDVTLTATSGPSQVQHLSKESCAAPPTALSLHSAASTGALVTGLKLAWKGWA